MQWWNDFLGWTGSNGGWRIVSGAIIPFIAIVLAGVIAALIGRAATKRAIDLHEREARNAAVSNVVAAARKAANWGNLGHDERAYADHLAEDADIRLRLLPIPGAVVAANWAQHEIADIKKNSSTFSFQAEQSLAEFRDRMLEWQARPARARKLFRADLERWKFETPDPDQDLIRRQQQWNADHKDEPAGHGSRPHQEARPASTTTSPATTSLASAASDRSADGGTNGPRTGSSSALTPPSAGTAQLGVRDGGRDMEAEDRSPVRAPLPQVTGALTEPKVDVTTGAVPTNTTSVAPRIDEGRVEPADPAETNESPYAAPVSASELRRRAEDEDDDL